MSLPASISAAHAALHGPWTVRARNRLIAVVVLALVVALTVVGVHGGSSGPPPVDLRVVSIADPLGLGATTEAMVALHNRGHREILPRFSLSLLAYPYYWRIVSGPPALEPGQSATYTIEAPDSVSAPPDGEPFQIKVNDARGITYAISRPIETAKRDLPIVNPTLGMWTQRDPASRLISPAGWSIYQRRHSDDRTSIDLADVFGVHAAHFHVVQTGQPDPGAWSVTGLAQDVAFPDRPFDIQVLSRTPYQAITGGWLLTAFGIQILYGRSGMIWLLFEPTNNGDLEYDLPDGNHVKVYDVPYGQWATQTIDLTALFRQLHRKVPETVAFALFIGASSAGANDIDGYIASISLHSSASAGSEVK